jgi:hypothetical protein
MKPAKLWLLWAVAILGSALAVAVAAPGAASAHAAAQGELVALGTTSAHVKELASLRSRLAHGITEPQGGAGTLAERVAPALAEAGMASSALQGVSPESQVGGGDSVARRRATITFSATLPDLGRFLDAWRAREPAWTVTGIDLAPERRGDAPLPPPAATCPSALSLPSSPSPSSAGALHEKAAAHPDGGERSAVRSAPCARLRGGRDALLGPVRAGGRGAARPAQG